LALAIHVATWSLNPMIMKTKKWYWKWGMCVAKSWWRYEDWGDYWSSVHGYFKRQCHCV